jgi:branched-chain amino acid transport system ATP-binding protein
MNGNGDLKIRSLSVRYETVSALKGLDIDLPEGEILAVLGANGAGKSTLLKTISGLVKAEAGTVEYAGQDLFAVQPHNLVRLGIAHVPEGRRVFSTLTVEENLRMGVHALRGAAAGKAYPVTRDRCFELFPILKERKSQLAGTLSGGEQQMLAIARALVAKPRLLLLDEPSLGLAPIVIKDIFRTIAAIRKEEGISILLVEQNARQALAVADRAVILELGAIALAGKASELANDEGLKAAYLGGHAVVAT